MSCSAPVPPQRNLIESPSRQIEAWWEPFRSELFSNCAKAARTASLANGFLHLQWDVVREHLTAELRTARIDNETAAFVERLLHHGQLSSLTVRGPSNAALGRGP
jgi:hypothetical protein